MIKDMIQLIAFALFFVIVFMCILFSRVSPSHNTVKCTMPHGFIEA